MPVSPSARLVQLPLVTDRGRARAALVALRPRQWPKNLLLFAGIVFAGELGDPGRLAAAVTAFIAYCAASSAGYLVNDVVDARDDRLHPTKRNRPVARGELSTRTALKLAGGLAAFAVAAVAPLGVSTSAFLLAFLALQAAYTGGLKRLVLVDVLAIAALFVIRAAAGADAVDVRISPWLLVCTGLLALFLGLAKRRAELVLVAADVAPGRPALRRYSAALVERLLAVAAASTLLAYVAYAVAAHSHAMLATTPFVVFGVSRYLFLVRRDDLGEEPENVLFSDRLLLTAVFVWAATAAGVLAIA